MTNTALDMVRLLITIVGAFAHILLLDGRFRQSYAKNIITTLPSMPPLITKFNHKSTLRYKKIAFPIVTEIPILASPNPIASLKCLHIRGATSAE